MAKRIYIVAADRIKTLAKLEKCGLHANVGETDRTIEERLKDKDYRRKNPGGKWITIYDSGLIDGITDREIHQHLKCRPDVKWDQKSDNTEEFLFINDSGDGKEAKRIVEEIVRRIALPLLQQEIDQLRSENENLKKENEKLRDTDFQKEILELHRTNDINMTKYRVLQRKTDLTEQLFERSTKDYRELQEAYLELQVAAHLDPRDDDRKIVSAYRRFAVVLFALLCFVSCFAYNFHTSVQQLHTTASTVTQIITLGKSRQ